MVIKKVNKEKKLVSHTKRSARLIARALRVGFTQHSTLAQPKLSAGFTLIETLVAITVLVVAVASPLSLAAQSLFAAYYAKDQVIAYNLAQEAIELIRNKRDHNILEDLDGGNAGWLNGMGAGAVHEVVIDIRSVSNNNYTLSNRTATNERVVFNGVTYTQDDGSCTTPCKKTPFTRYVIIKKINGSEIKVTAVVSWKTGAFSNRVFQISETLYEWTRYIN